MKTRTLVAVLATLLMSSSTFAAQIFLSTSTTFGTSAAADAASLVNPVLNIAPGGTATLAVWVKVPKPSLQSDPDGEGGFINTYTPIEKVVGMGIDLVQDTAIAKANGNFTVTGTASRWDGPAGNPASGAPNTANGEISNTPGVNLARFQRFAVSGAGIGGVVNQLVPAPTTPGDAQTTNILSADGNFVYQRFALVPIIDSGLGGTTGLFITTNNVVVGYNPGSATGQANFGALDPAVTAGQPGVKSSVADATIIVATVPEPASLGFLALGALGLIRRRMA